MLCLVYLLLCKEEGSVGFWDGDYVSQYVWYYISVKISLRYAHEECESTNAYVF